MTSEPEAPTIVTLDDTPPVDAVRVGGADATELLAEVRRRTEVRQEVVISPDGAADDMDDWLGIVAAAVVEGATAVETRHTREARRVLTVHRAIATGGEELLR